MVSFQTKVGKKLSIRFSYLCGMETTISAPVNFTSNAIDEITRLMNEEGFDQSQLLRVGVKGGGCSGMTYILGFDKQEANDEVYEAEGFRFLMNKSHGIYL